MNGNQVWKIISLKYMKVVVKKLEKRPKKKGGKLPDRATLPMPSDYRLEIYTIGELDTNSITIYQ